MSWPDPLAGTRQGVAWEQGAGYRHDPIDPAAADALRVDLWHAAINGRGTFTPASNAEALSKAFKTILSEIKEPKDPPLTSIAADSSKFRTGQFFYRGSYDRKSWTGDVLASRVQDDGTLRQAWSAKSQLDRRVEGDGFNTRTVLSSSAAGGIPFRWSNLSDAQKGALQGAPFAREMDSSAGQTALNFLRGQRAAEGTSSGGETWRVRASVLGDIVGSTIWYAGRPNDGFLSRGYAQFSANNASRPAMLYVGANDGMLHAFNATTGVETFAYVPQGLYGTTAASLLRSYTRSGYTHRYLVDGSPFVGDVYLGSASDAASPDTSNVDRWRSLLVGTLGAGGKGYFVLDVTDPAGVSEANAGSVVLIDTSAGTDPDIGHQFQQPTVGGAPRRAKQFVRLNNDRPALILGNGYNSSNEKAVLLVQYLDGDRSLVKLYTSSTESAGDGNGLSAPQMVDRNGDGKVDYVYAGDLKGRLWKFDLSSSEQRAWKATTGHTPEGSTTTDDQHLFQTDAGQPITAAPTVVAHPRGVFMVVFGTGRTFAADDWQTTTSQALYGVWDNSTGTVLKSNLVERNITQEGRPPQRFIPPAGVAFGGTDGKMGWFMALPQSGERLVYPSEALDGSTVLFNTLVPGVATDTVSCTEGKSDTGWVMVLDLFGGGSVGTNVFGSTDADSTSLVGYALTDASRVISQTIAASREKICDTLGNCRDVQHKKLGRRFAWRDLVPIK
jgi:type IV pilus assembly protein PilY1